MIVPTVDCINIVNTECDLELSLFTSVAPVCLFKSPFVSTLYASSADVTVLMDKFSTYTPFFTSSLSSTISALAFFQSIRRNVLGL